MVLSMSIELEIAICYPNSNPFPNRIPVAPLVIIHQHEWARREPRVLFRLKQPQEDDSNSPRNLLT